MSGTDSKWANPTPAGLVALAVATFGFFAKLTGAIEPSGELILGLWLIGGFVIQLCVGLIDLKNGNQLGGNTFLYFSAYFMLVSGASMILKFFLNHHGITVDSRVDGWAWIALTITVYTWGIGYFKQSIMLGLVVACLFVACPCIALLDLKVIPAEIAPGFAHIPAYALLTAGLIALYMSAAGNLNHVFGKQILPLK